MNKTISIMPREFSMATSIWQYTVASMFVLIIMLSANAFAEGPKLAVINKKGEVWARDLDLSNRNLGVGLRLTGPSLFGRPDDQFVIASINSIAVVNTSGAFWPRTVDDSMIGPGANISGSLFGSPNAKYVLDARSCDQVYVINNKGEVWSHAVGATAVSAGRKLNGPTIFGAPNDKYAVHNGESILIVNSQGEVWAHDLASSTPNSFCGTDTVRAGYKLSGPGLFGAPNDKYVVGFDNHLLVVNSLGEVWARNTTRSEVGPGFKLSGPGLFGGADHKYVVAYYVRSAVPPPK